MEPIFIKDLKLIQGAHQTDSLSTELLTPQNTLGDMLASESTAFIKSYGPGSSSTISMRGGNANQTLVMWNGISISNPMLSLSDFSLIPANLFNSSTLYEGGSTGINGSGAVTGFINLNNKFSYTGLNNILTFSKGCFGRNTMGAKHSYNYKKFSHSLNILYDEAKNDFKYRLNDKSQKTNTNAAFNNKALIYSAEYLINENSKLDFNVWQQNAFRQIPPTTTQSLSVANQKDRTARYLLNYFQSKGAVKIKGQLAYFNESNIYSDSLIQVYNKNKFERWHANTSLLYAFGKFSEFNVKVNFQKDKAESKAYETAQTNNLKSISAFWDHDIKNHSLSLGFLKEWNDISKAPLAPMLSFTSEWAERKYIQIVVSKEYRVPGLNDIFWRPGGNKDLKTEQGWNQEINFINSLENTDIIKIAFYHRVIDNWIQWTQAENSFLFKAQNIARVRSYGFTLKTEFRIKALKLEHNFNTQYAFTRSVNLVSIQNPKIEAGSQLFYTPIHKLIFNYSLHCDSWNLELMNAFTGATTGFNENMKAFHITDLKISKCIRISKLESTLTFNIYNIFNKDYRIIERRPMPGRHYNFSIQTKF
jgi:iron complex outermembrane receptor protein